MAVKMRATRTAWYLAAVLAVEFGGLAYPRNSADARQKAIFDAILAGHTGTVETLLRQGIDVNATNSYCHDTLLILAINFRRPEIVKLLLVRGAKLKAEGGLIPLALAAMRENAAIVKLLLAHGAKVDTPDPSQDGATPLFLAAAHCDIIKIKSDREAAAVVDSLLAAGANPNPRNRRDGKTALMWAAYHGQAALVRSLIAHGAKVNATDKQGVTVLMHAVGPTWTSPSVVKLLLASGAHVNAKSKAGWTALMQAADSGNALVVKLLLAQGADVSARTPKDGRTALDRAQEFHPDLVPLLKQARAKR
jgi:ankyrin repeat protein